jgi:hypothetical protein
MHWGIDLRKSESAHHVWQRTSAVVLADLLSVQGATELSEFSPVRLGTFLLSWTFQTVADCTRWKESCHVSSLLASFCLRVTPNEIASREFCKILKNVAELNEKTRKKCLIRDVIVTVLQILPVFA